ncbi:MAG: protein kinase family protein [Hydrogenobaculum sp.]
MSSEDKTIIEDKTILENKDDDKTKIENKEQQVYQGPTENLNITTFRKHKIVEDLPAKGGESDNYIIEYEGKKAFLKLYRKGIIPKVDLDKIKKLFEEDKDHFVEIYEAGIDDKTQRYYEIMEYIQYGDLKNLINELSSKTIKQKESTIDKVISEIAEALKVLHNNNIIHRDLKPSNVLIRNKDNINLVLIDFGIAKELEQDISKSGTTSFKGTMQYIAPEEISDYFGKEIDWWHLGIIAYELINGSNPFKGLTDNVIVHTLATKGVEIPKDIPQKYQILLKGLLTRDYKKRWGYEEVKRWLSGDTNINFYYEEAEKSDDEVEKEWQKYNIPPDSNWRKLGLSPSETKSFIDAGFGYNDAKKWTQVGWASGTIARTWYNAGFEPEEALIFEDLGFSIKQASFLKSKGITALDLEPLRKYKDEKPDLVDEIYSIVQSEDFSKSQDTTNALKKLLREYQNWSKISKSLKDAYDLILLGFSYEEASQCLGNNRPNQNCAEIWHRKGLELQKLKRYNEALKCFDKATQLEPNNANYWYSKGILLKYLNRYEEALQSFDKAIQLEPNNALYWANKGFVLGNLGRHEEALQCFDKVIQLKPDNDMLCLSWENKGFALENLGRYKEALQCYDKAIDIKPWDAEYWYDKARVFEKLNKFNEARRCRLKAERLQDKEKGVTLLDRLKDLPDLIPEKYKKAGAFLLFLTLILIFIIYHAEIFRIFLHIVEIIFAIVAVIAIFYN